jgi:hypothetical protein
MQNSREISLPHLFTPREYQLNLLDALDSGIKRAVWIVHRRGGKDLTTWNWIIKKAMEEKLTIFYLLPTYSQAKKIIWEGMTKDGIRFIDFIPKEIIEKKSEAELSIRFKHTGSLIQLLGSENYDRLVGTNPQICVFSEMALQNPTSWQYLRPILVENNGVAIFISTPRGKNHFYDLFRIAEESPEWFCERLTVDDTNVISEDAIEKERQSGMSDELIDQEFHCSFDIGMEGAYYAKSIKKAIKEGRIGHVPCDKNLLVYTNFDIGFSDSTAILFYQKRGNEVLFIDYYENRGYNLAHYIEVLKSKGYDYGKHFIPHDGKNHNATGTTYQQVARGLGIEMTVLKKETSVIEGIERVRGIFPRIFIDKEKCAYFVKCLLQYHAEFNEKDHIFKNYPKHDWSSHAADALRYMSMVINEIGEAPTQTLEEWRERKRKQSGYGGGKPSTIEDFMKPGW